MSPASGRANVSEASQLVIADGQRDALFSCSATTKLDTTREPLSARQQTSDVAQLSPARHRCSSGIIEHLQIRLHQSERTCVASCTRSDRHGHPGFSSPALCLASCCLANGGADLDRLQPKDQLPCMAPAVQKCSCKKAVAPGMTRPRLTADMAPVTVLHAAAYLGRVAGDHNQAGARPEADVVDVARLRRLDVGEVLPAVCVPHLHNARVGAHHLVACVQVESGLN